MRCPICKAAVHESAFHHIEKKTTFIVGETVLKWDMATAALQKQQNPMLARIEVRRARHAHAQPDLDRELVVDLLHASIWEGSARRDQGLPARRDLG